MSRVNLTAFVLTLALKRLAEDTRGKAEIPPDAVPYYTAFIDDIAEQEKIFSFLATLPRRLLFPLFDYLIIPEYALHMARRKQVMERWARESIGNSIRQIVVIGAGFDALAIRLAKEFPALHCFELDVPDTQNAKRHALGAHSLHVPDNMHFIACDLSQTPLKTVLAETPGFIPQAPTLYIAEGLTMYLTEAENRGWMRAALEISGPDTRIAFTVLEESPGRHVGQKICDFFLKKRTNQYVFTRSPSDIKSFLAPFGMSVSDHVLHPKLHGWSEPPAISRRQEHLFLATVQ